MKNKIKRQILLVLIWIFEPLTLDYKNWVFNSSYNSKFNYNSKYFFEYVLNLDNQIQPIFIIDDPILRNQMSTVYGKQYFVSSLTYSGLKTIRNAGVWVTSAGLPYIFLQKNKYRVIYNLWHGVPLKKIGLLENKLSNTYKKIYKSLYSEKYTKVLCTSTKIADVYMQSFGINYDRLLFCGQPRNAEIHTESKLNLRGILNIDDKISKLILYAPTFRENMQTKLFPFPNFNIYLLNNELQKIKATVLISMHQSEANVQLEELSNIKFLKLPSGTDTAEILNQFDLLITDYSSIFIDFLILEKPIVFLPYDYKEYTKLRGFNFDYNSVTPGPKPSTIDNFIFEIKKLLEDDSYYLNERTEANDFFNEHIENTNKIIYDDILKSLSIKGVDIL